MSLYIVWLCTLLKAGYSLIIIIQGMQACCKNCTLRKWLGTRLHNTGVRNWTWSLGGHWGTGFLLSLLNRPADRGITFWRETDVFTIIQHNLRRQPRETLCTSLRRFISVNQKSYYYSSLIWCCIIIIPLSQTNMTRVVSKINRLRNVILLLTAYKNWKPVSYKSCRGSVTSGFNNLVSTNNSM